MKPVTPETASTCAVGSSNGESSRENGFRGMNGSEKVAWTNPMPMSASPSSVFCFSDTMERFSLVTY